MNRRQGFTLIELMVVLAVIAIIMVIAIPSLLDARKSANEASATSSLRTLTTANDQYRTRFSTNGYAPDLPTLQVEGYIDSVLASGVKSGYQFTYTPGAAFAGIIQSWTCVANAVVQGSTGDRSFFVDESGVIHYKEGPGATSADPSID